MSEPGNELFVAIGPLLDAIGADPVPTEYMEQGDIPIEWHGELVGGVRLPPLSDSLGILISRIEGEVGAPLNEMNRVQKQIAIRRLDEQGAFLMRKSIESVADTMGVSRITIYNYLNAIREK